VLAKEFTFDENECLLTGSLLKLSGGEDTRLLFIIQDLSCSKHPMDVLLRKAHKVRAVVPKFYAEERHYSFR